MEFILSIFTEEFFYAVIRGVVSFVIYKTSWGLKIRAIGEVPKAADTIGINVIGWKYGMCILSSMIAAVAGAILSLSFMNCFVDNIVWRTRIYGCCLCNLRSMDNL